MLTCITAFSRLSTLSRNILFWNFSYHLDSFFLLFSYVVLIFSEREHVAYFYLQNVIAFSWKRT